MADARDWMAHPRTRNAKPERRRGRDLLTGLILLIAVSAMALVAYGQVAASRITRAQTELTPVADGVSNRVATAHLYLVQALGGDESVMVADDVFGRLAEATRLVDSAYNGGPSIDGTIIHPATDPVVVEDLRLLVAQVDSFTSQASSRWLHRESTGQIGTKSDQEFDALFTKVVEQTDRLAADLRRTEERARTRIQTVNIAVLGTLAALFVGVAVFARRTRRTIVAKNAELETRVQERTAALALSEARTTAIVNTAVDAIITIDDRGIIRSINPATERIFGYESDELVGANVSVLMTEEDQTQHDGYIRRYLSTGLSHILGSGRETVALRKDGTVIPIDISVSEAKVGQDRMFVGLIRDITERKRVEAELQAAKAAAEEAATHDPLTGLWNHNRIIEILMEELSRSDRQGSPVSLAMVDLDHFKQVNDTYGHVVGDEVLREVAARLQRAIRVYDAVGRFGGEEFMVVLPGTEGVAAEQAAERIREEISQQPVITSAGALQITASLGLVTRVGEIVHDATALLVAADSALYDAKEAGRDRITIASMQSS
jgi:diguanylate cyclase (GGDEF)-like protein/PAS domain S-box-containing protein